MLSSLMRIGAVPICTLPGADAMFATVRGAWCKCELSDSCEMGPVIPGLVWSRKPWLAKSARALFSLGSHGPFFGVCDARGDGAARLHETKPQLPGNGQIWSNQSYRAAALLRCCAVLLLPPLSRVCEFLRTHRGRQRTGSENSTALSSEIATVLLTGRLKLKTYL